MLETVLGGSRRQQGQEEIDKFGVKRGESGDMDGRPDIRTGRSILGLLGSEGVLDEAGDLDGDLVDRAGTLKIIYVAKEGEIEGGDAVSE